MSECDHNHPDKEVIEALKKLRQEVEELQKQNEVDEKTIVELQKKQDDHLYSDTPMKIFVKTLHNRKYSIEILPSDSILDLKKKYSAITGHPPRHQLLFFGGQPLANFEELQGLGIKNGSEVYVVDIVGGPMRLCDYCGTPLPKGLRK